jgi:methyltransferase (TIGR00027 family)
MSMERTDDDTWDLASSVGATATIVAAARAVASRSADPLIDDPFAEPLVRAVGIDFFTGLASGELDPADFDDDAARSVQEMADVMAVRTRYFDEFFAQAGEAGIRQAVILASGLDSRAYRLPWPAGTTVFEVDQPQVIEFKTATLADLGAVPTADRRVVAIDLRHDWPAALLHAGFHADRPTAWIAEGLLNYLPPDAQDRLLDHITVLSTAGSRLATESIPNLQQPDEYGIVGRMRALTERWRDHGLDLDLTDLMYLGDRSNVDNYLTTRGWATVGTPTSELFVANGLPRVDWRGDDQPPFADAFYLSATLK